MTGPVRALVVEDEPLSRELLVRILSGRGLDVHSVIDGPACLDWLDGNEVDLVLLDVSMPGMSGLDVLRSIRSTQAADRLPVILVTALVDSDDVVAGLEAGANDYIVKPVNPSVLMARIGVAVRIKRGVERLVAAERHQVLLQSLAETCDKISQPMTSVLSHLESLSERLPGDEAELRTKLAEIQSWAQRVGDLLEKLRVIADHRGEPYTDGLGSFIGASLQAALDRGATPDTPAGEAGRTAPDRS